MAAGPAAGQWISHLQTDATSTTSCVAAQNWWPAASLTPSPRRRALPLLCRAHLINMNHPPYTKSMVNPNFIRVRPSVRAKAKGAVGKPDELQERGGKAEWATNGGGSSVFLLVRKQHRHCLLPGERETYEGSKEPWGEAVAMVGTSFEGRM